MFSLCTHNLFPRRDCRARRAGDKGSSFFVNRPRAESPCPALGDAYSAAPDYYPGDEDSLAMQRHIYCAPNDLALLMTAPTMSHGAENTAAAPQEPALASPDTASRDTATPTLGCAAAHTPTRR